MPAIDCTRSSSTASLNCDDADAKSSLRPLPLRFEGGRLVGTIPGVPWRVKLFCQNVLWRNPALYYPLGLLRQGASVFQTRYDLLVEGYPRSGNTYARRMLELTQGSNMHFASHKHVPPFILSGVSRRKPAILLLRKPEDAIASFHVLTGAHIPYLVRQWTLYYTIMQRHLDYVYLLQFEELVANFQGAVSRIEEKFKLGLSSAFDEASIRKLAMKSIETYYVPNDESSRIVNVPNERRSAWLKAVKSRVVAAPAFDAAVAVHSAIASRVTSQA